MTSQVHPVVPRARRAAAVSDVIALICLPIVSWNVWCQPALACSPVPVYPAAVVADVVVAQILARGQRHVFKQLLVELFRPCRLVKLTHARQTIVLTVCLDCIHDHYIIIVVMISFKKIEQNDSQVCTVNLSPTSSEHTPKGNTVHIHLKCNATCANAKCNLPSRDWLPLTVFIRS